jgi:hypothetical protein
MTGVLSVAMYLRPEEAIDKAEFVRGYCSWVYIRIAVSLFI